MRKFNTIVPAAALLLSSACADTTGPHNMEQVDGPLLDVSQSAICYPTGLGSLEANYINTVPSDPFEVTCDIGIFFAQPGTIDGARVMGTVAGSKPVQYGIYIAGAGVDVVNSTIEVDANFPHQFISIAYRDGASGTISNNELRGSHRVGINLRGAGTSTTVRDNTIVGSGPKTSGWAENGLQIDQNATADVVNNTFEGHWWDGPSNWASTAAMILSDGVKVTNNRFVDNEFSIYVAGGGNTVTSNRTSSAVVSGSFYAYGALLYGANNHLSGNYMTAVNGAVGLYIYGGSASNRMTGNRFDGFAYPVYDGGDDTMIRGKPTPLAP